MHDRTHKLLMSKMQFIFNKLTIPICCSTHSSECCLSSICFSEVILVRCQYFQGYLKSLVELPTLETGDWCSPLITRTFSAAIPGKKYLQPVICKSSIVKESLFYPECLGSSCKLSLSLIYKWNGS